VSRPTRGLANPVSTPSGATPQDKKSAAGPGLVGRHPYDGRRAVLATKHGKLALLGPAISHAVGLDVVAAEVDTDRLGTFTGDIPRPHPPLETAIRKARLGMAATGSPIGLASEGSIGPDPALPLLISDCEIVVLVDDQLGIVIHSTHVGYDIVSASTTAKAEDDLEEFLTRADFPRHQLTVRPNQGPVRPIHKGVADRHSLAAAITEAVAASTDGAARVETDLRAHVCPSRQAVITAAAQRLAARIVARCPACATPGWGPVEVVVGVPCLGCGHPVEVPIAEIDGCVSCEYRHRRPLSDAPTSADPGTCQICNP
jgi:hypothetical protein